MENLQNISGIFNYCDRWCERCTFTDRCSNFEYPVGKTKITDENLFEMLSEIFDEIKEMVRKTVEESGEDWQEFLEQANKIERKDPEWTDTQIAIKNLSEQYYTEVLKWFESNEDTLKSKENEFNLSLRLGIDVEEKAEKLVDALEVIRWYMFFIAAKIQRAFNGLNRVFPEDIEDFEEDPIQNDSHGSAKIAKIAIERSIAAWEIVRSYFPEKTDALIDFLVFLSKMRKGILELIPDVDKFRRPGFDD